MEISTSFAPSLDEWLADICFPEGFEFSISIIEGEAYVIRWLDDGRLNKLKVSEVIMGFESAIKELSNIN